MENDTTIDTSANSDDDWDFFGTPSASNIRRRPLLGTAARGEVMSSSQCNPTTCTLSSGVCVDCTRCFNHCQCDGGGGSGGMDGSSILPTTCDTPSCYRRMCSYCLRCANHCVCGASSRPRLGGDRYYCGLASNSFGNVDDDDDDIVDDSMEEKMLKTNVLENLHQEQPIIHDDDDDEDVDSDSDTRENGPSLPRIELESIPSAPPLPEQAIQKSPPDCTIHTALDRLHVLAMSRDDSTTSITSYVDDISLTVVDGDDHNVKEEDEICFVTTEGRKISASTGLKIITNVNVVHGGPLTDRTAPLTVDRSESGRHNRTTTTIPGTTCSIKGDTMNPIETRSVSWFSRTTNHRK
jgi:hypothetical protein